MCTPRAPVWWTHQGESQLTCFGEIQSHPGFCHPGILDQDRIMTESFGISTTPTATLY